MSDSVTLWTVGYQAPLSIGLSRQEYWSGLVMLFSGDLPVYSLLKLKKPGYLILQEFMTFFSFLATPRDCGILVP